jgi:hypothetical protein
LAGGSALWGFVNVLAARWRKSNKNLLRVGHFFQSTENCQRTSVVSVSTVPVKGVRSFFIFYSSVTWLEALPCPGGY